ncbi:MAG: diacylglycerol kinase family lipid kinase [Cyclobacteriaceae bacterium]|nr:diacylglycerol kinase family lipid kinase [Cyclobacteriaceae bacterium]
MPEVGHTFSESIHQRKGSVRSVCIILNGISLRKKFFYAKVLPALQDVVNAEVWETRSKNDAVTLAAKAVGRSYDAVVAAGGDGTLHQVLNGMLKNHEQAVDLPVLGLIPLGSGNDFARTIGVKRDVHDLKNLFSSFTTSAVDIGKIIFPESSTPPRYFINIADVGMGPIVVERLLNSGRAFGSLVAYYMAIIHTFFTYRTESVKVQTSLWKWEGVIRSLAVANGKFFGNGIGIAPDAVVDDGKFSCFIAGNVSVLDFIIQNGRLRKGKRAIHDEIEYREADIIELSGVKPLAIEADGELVGKLPVRIEVLPKQLKFLC